MGCEDICISSYDGELADIYNELVRKARVNHTCYECARMIKPGELYEVVKGRWDGDWATYRFCAECSEIGKAFACGGSRTFGILWEDIADQVFPELTTVCLNKLTTTAAKAALVERWNQWKFRHGRA